MNIKNDLLFTEWKKNRACLKFTHHKYSLLLQHTSLLPTNLFDFFFDGRQPCAESVDRTPCCLDYNIVTVFPKIHHSQKYQAKVSIDEGTTVFHTCLTCVCSSIAALLLESAITKWKDSYTPYSWKISECQCYCPISSGLPKMVKLRRPHSKSY